MRIISARWEPTCNILTIECKECGCVFDHPGNRWHVRCPKCRNLRHLQRLRDDYNLTPPATISEEEWQEHIHKPF